MSSVYSMLNSSVDQAKRPIIVESSGQECGNAFKRINAHWPSVERDAVDGSPCLFAQNVVGSVHFQIEIQGNSRRLQNVQLSCIIEVCTFVMRSFPFGNSLRDAARTLSHLLAVYVRPIVCGARILVKLQNEESIVEDATALILDIDTKPTWGFVDIVWECASAGIYLLNIEPGKSIPLHRHLLMKEAEMVITDGTYCQGIVMPFGKAHRWGTKRHHYNNPSPASPARIVCIDSPRFDPTDELVLLDEPIDPIDESVDAAHDVNYLWNAIRNGASKLTAVFPGAYDGQTVSLSLHKPRDIIRVTEKYDAVVVLVLDSELRVLQTRHHTRGWEWPGGKIELLESPEDAARREVFEETGFELSVPLHCIGSYSICSNELSVAHRKLIVLATLSTEGAATCPPPGSEASRARWEDSALSIAETNKSELSRLILDDVYYLSLNYAVHGNKLSVHK